MSGSGGTASAAGGSDGGSGGADAGGAGGAPEATGGAVGVGGSREGSGGEALSITANRPYEIYPIQTSGDEAVYDVVAHPDGGFVISGGTTGSVEGETASVGAVDGFLIHLSETGEVVWASQFGEAGGSVYADRLLFGGDGGLYVLGRASGEFLGQNFGSDDVFLAKFDEAGEWEWGFRFGSQADDYGFDLALHESGDVLVLSVFDNFRGSLGYQQGQVSSIRRVNSLGDVVEETILPEDVPITPMFLRVAPDGRAFVAGLVKPSTQSSDVFPVVAEVTSTGEISQSRILERDADFWIQDLGMGSGGQIYVVGNEQTSESPIVTKAGVFLTLDGDLEVVADEEREQPGVDRTSYWALHVTDVGSVRLLGYGWGPADSGMSYLWIDEFSSTGEQLPGFEASGSLTFAPTVWTFLSDDTPVMIGWSTGPNATLDGYALRVLND